MKKQIIRLLAFALCLCLLPFGALAYADEPISFVDMTTLYVESSVQLSGEWGAFTPEQDGIYTFSAVPMPAFVEIFVPGTQAGDWATYNADKQAYYEGANALLKGTAQYNAAREQYLQAKAVLEEKKPLYDEAVAKMDQMKQDCDQATVRLGQYKELLSQAQQLGIVNADMSVNPGKGLAYLQVLGTARQLGITTLPANYRDFPAYAQEQIRLCEETCSMYQSAELQLKEYEDSCRQVEDAEKKLEQAEAMLAEGYAAIALKRSEIQAEADAIRANAPSGTQGLALQEAAWLLEAGDVCASYLQGGVPYIVHFLSDAPVTVTVRQEHSPTGFVDVPSRAYYAPAVAWAVSNGITQGTDSTHFSPDRDCTRAQIVTLLWRAAGQPSPKSDKNPFADVPADAYYRVPVLWAVEQGITKGTSATTFSPDAACTRAQAVTFLWRMEHEPKASDSFAPRFADVDGAAYYAPAVFWAVEQGVTRGTDDTHFSPDLKCSRAQIVTFLYRDKVDA